MGLRYLFQRYNGHAARIAFGGIVGRSENRAMLRYLKVQMVPGDKIDYRSFDLIAMVDSQPGFRYNPMPADVVPQIVIDHHPPREGSVPESVEFRVLEEGYGATATIVGEIFSENGIPIPGEVATALAYGIKAETQDLGRETSDADIRVYSWLYPRADKRIMSRIEGARVPENYFRVFEKAIERAVIYHNVIYSDLGPIEVPDMVAEMADFLLRLEGMRCSFVVGEFGETIYLSLRSSEESPGAGEAIAAALEGTGSCGGHQVMAGGQLPVPGLSPEEVEAEKQRILSNLLDHLKVKRTLRRLLVPREEEGRPEDP